MKFSLNLFLLFLSFNTTNQSDKEIITMHLSDENFNYKIHIVDKNLKNVLSSKVYYWYKSQEIHLSKGGYDGQLLNGDYVKFYKSNQIAEKGSFNKGLKNEIWTQWYKNGNKKEIIRWKSGLRNGKYRVFNDDGKMIISGEYKNNLKSSIWINYILLDTSYYKKGKLLKEKPKSLLDKIGGIFKKKETINNRRVLKKKKVAKKNKK